MSPLDVTKHFSGDFRRLTRTIGVAIAFFGLLLLAIIAYAGWSANHTAYEIERTLLENALNQSIARALNEQKSIAWWDDPVVKITDRVLDMEFTDANFGVFLTETYAHDEVYILNAKDRPIYAFGDAKTHDPSVFERAPPGARCGHRRDTAGRTARSSKPVPTCSASRKGGYRVPDRRPGRALGRAHRVDRRPARRRCRHDDRAQYRPEST